MRRKDIEGLLAGLESEDAFARLEAETRLRERFQRDFGFRWDGTPAVREQALARLREFLARSTRKPKADRPRAAEPLVPMETVDLEKLKGLPAKEVEKHLQALLGKAGLLAGFTIGRPRCEACGQRPATVEIVDVAALKARSVTRLCDPCAAGRGEVR